MSVLEKKRRIISEPTCEEARGFLLNEENYYSLELPSYFRFGPLLSELSNRLNGRYRCGHPRNCNLVNFTILNNKDGLYSWRPIEFIHPVLYVSLVNEVTQPRNWETICERFGDFESIPNIECLSLSVDSLTRQSNKAEQIGMWWTEVEQKSIELSIDYEFIVRTDIVDCYASMYTHSIAWALHGKKFAKENRKDKSLTGNIIDNYIQDMHQGQTNGIPQGPVLMDMIAELVMGYADAELSERLRCDLDTDYRILRYRDDYRIFVNTRKAGEIILKNLTEVMFDLGLKLNPAKTEISNKVIRSSVKEDKIDWIFRRQHDDNLQKHLMIIHDHGMQHPNSGSVVRALAEYHKRISEDSGGIPKNLSQLISITTDIAYHSPRTYPVAVAILSKLIKFFETTEEKADVITKVLNKFSRIPNTGYLEVWLQRISHKLCLDVDFKEPLCRLVNGHDDEIWNSNWISFPDLREVMRLARIVDQEELDKLDVEIHPKEVEMFLDAY